MMMLMKLRAGPLAEMKSGSPAVVVVVVVVVLAGQMGVSGLLWYWDAGGLLE
jgi:hypothetical protein